MNIISAKNLLLPEIMVISFKRFTDHRGYFVETYRETDFSNIENIKLLKNFRFVQCNESYSKKNTIRGLHFQWNPYMGKLVRVVKGKMIDMVLDIRKGSLNFGKILLYEMTSDNRKKTGEWIWIPPSFAHGNLFLKDTIIEYFCTGHYNPNCEAGISPLAKDFDWSFCDKRLKRIFDEISSKTELISTKDRHGFTLSEWAKNPLSNNFIYKKK